MASEPTRIELTRRGDAAEVLLRPPPGKPPTLDYAVLDALDAALARIEADVPRLVVVKSNESKYFCVGANLAVVRETDAAAMSAWVERGHDVLLRLESLPCPTLAQVDGYAVGGGLELVMACDIIFAGAGGRLGLTEANLGLIPGWGGCLRLPERVGPARAKWMFFSGAVLDAAEALRVGLVDAVFDDLDAAVAAYAAEVAQRSAGSAATFKRLLAAERADARQRNRAAESAQTPDRLRDPDTQQRLADFFEKRKR